MGEAAATRGYPVGHWCGIPGGHPRRGGRPELSQREIDPPGIGRQIRGVGLRFKGNGTFIEARTSGHYSFKIDFNEFDPDQEFLGLTKINLQNKVSDPTMLREALSYELFREAGIPCPRVG